MLVRGFAALSFPDSAGLSFARATERAFADPAVDHPEAWSIEERRVEFAFEGHLTPAEVEAHKRLLGELLREASEGEAYLDVEGERWDAQSATSGVPRPEQSGPAVRDPEMSTPTIRTKIGS